MRKSQAARTAVIHVNCRGTPENAGQPHIFTTTTSLVGPGAINFQAAKMVRQVHVKLYHYVSLRMKAHNNPTFDYHTLSNRILDIVKAFPKSDQRQHNGISSSRILVELERTGGQSIEAGWCIMG